MKSIKSVLTGLLLVPLLIGSTLAQNDWEFVNVTNTFLPRASFGSASASDATGELAYFFGGIFSTDFTTGQATFYNDLWSLRAVAGQYLFTEISITGTAKPSARAQVGFAVSNDYMLVVGGTAVGISSDVSWLFDRAAKTWTDVSLGGPSVRTKSTVVTNVDGSSSKFYVHGGLSNTATILDDYWEFDASTKNWTALANANGRFESRGAMLGGVSFFYGGSSTLQENILTSTAVFAENSDGSITSSLTDPTGAPGISFGGFTPIRNGQLFLLTGGSNAQVNPGCGGSTTGFQGSNETYAFDPFLASWSTFPQGESNGGVIDGGLVEIGSSVILVGGYFYECDAAGAGPGRVNVDGGIYTLSIATPSPTGSPSSQPSMAPSVPTSAALDVTSPSRYLMVGLGAVSMLFATFM